MDKPFCLEDKKMNVSFNTSPKGCEYYDEYWEETEGIDIDSIKQAIKLLKESLCSCSKKGGVCYNCDEINRIFGKGLCE